LKETEEYKQTVSEMKSQLGKKYIRLDTIADCILRLPTVELQYAALQQVNTLLSGTAWSEKAAEVLETMFAKVKEQQDRQEQKQDKILDSMEKAVERPATMISHVENYQPQIQNQNIDLPTPPFRTHDKKRLDNE
jgi:hypothetical protein